MPSIPDAPAHERVPPERRRDWLALALLTAAFLGIVAAALGAGEFERTRRRREDVESIGKGAAATLRLRLQGNEHYLQLLAGERARGRLEAEAFQQRAGEYVARHPEFINITWVDNTLTVRDAAPVADSRYIHGLALDLPEPRRASALAVASRSTVYTAPFEAIRGRSTFEVWVPVFDGASFLGLLVGVYSCQALAGEALDSDTARLYRADVLGVDGSVLGSSSGPAAPEAGPPIVVPLEPPGSGVRLRLQRRDDVTPRTVMFVLVSIAVALGLGMGYSLWSHKREIERRKQIEQDLRDSRESARRSYAILESVVQGTSDAVYVKDADGRYVLLNAAGLGMFGTSAAKALGHDDTALFGREDAIEIMAADGRVMAGGVPLTYDEQADIGGVRHTFMSTKGPIRDGRGQVVGLFGIARDVTDRRRSEQEVLRLNRALRAIGACRQAMIHASDETALLRRVCEAIVAVGEYRMAWVGYAQHDNACSLQPVAQAGFEHGYLETLALTWADTELGRGAAGVAIRTGRPCSVADVASEAYLRPWHAEARTNGVASVLALPLREGDVVFGALTIASARPGAFDDADVTLLAGLADDLAYGVVALRTRAAQAEAEAALRESDRRLTFALEKSHTGGWDLDATDLTGHHTPTHARIFGYDPAASAWSFGVFLSHVLPEDRAAVERRFNDSRAAQADWSFECRIRRVDGAIRWIWVAGEYQRDADGLARRIGGIAQDITDRKEAEAALRESEERLRLLGDNLPDSYVFEYTREADGTRRFLYVSAGVERVHGVTADQVARDATLLLAGIEPGQLMALSAAASVSRRDMTDVDKELQFRNAGGQERWLRVRVRPRREPGGQILWDGVATDITPGKRLEDARQQEREFSDAVLNSLPGVLYCYDEDRRFRRWNRSFERVTGYSSAEIARMSPLDFFAGGQKVLVDARIREVFAGGTSEIEADFVAKDGSRTPYYFSGLATVIEGRPHLVGVGVDITRRKKDEDEIRRLHAELQRYAEELERRVSERTAELEVARNRAEAADRLKSAFLATMSHELRTPLNSIIGFTGILLQGLAGPLQAEQTTQLGMVRGSARQLLDLINDILDLSKIEAGQLQVHPEPFDLAASIERVCSAVRPLAGQKALALDLSLDPLLGTISSDRRRVEQVMMNLLDNAVKFTPAGRITVTARRLADCVAITVADTGIGITSGDQDSLFQPFRQIDSGLTRQHEGTGLGLAICRRLVDLLQGAIAVQSAPGAGSAFTVTLPLAPGNEAT
jgi:PAS domain S-box-containing protein